MNSDDLAFLTSPAGARLLDDLRAVDLQGDLVRHVTTLRKTYSAAQVSAAITQAELRRAAVPKFGASASRLFFTADALQQASDPLIRAYRADMVRGQQVLDLCCGIGADALAFAATNPHVCGIDYDAERIAIARHNAAALGFDHLHFMVDDVTATRYDADVIFFDPARRHADGRRIHDVNAYIPPLDTIDKHRAARRLVKASPAVDLRQLAGRTCRVQFISVAGDLKEALLHIDDADGLSATRIEPDGTRHHWDAPTTPPDVATDQPADYLIEPDPALIRAGLVRDLAAQIGGALLDPTIAYITADHAPDSVWCRAWRVLDWMPFNLKKLRAYLRGQGVGTVTVKKRGSAITPEALTAGLKLKGDASRTLVLTRHENRPIVMICADYTA